jgi:hypothetical protein
LKKLKAFVAVGLLAVAFQAQADEGKISQLDTALSSTTISGYVDVAATYNSGSEIQFASVPSVAYNFSSEMQPAPEPSSLALLMLSFATVGLIVKMRRKQTS